MPWPRWLGLVVYVISAATSVRAQEASVRAEVDARRVGVDDVVQLTVTIEGQGLDLAEDVRVPPLQNLRVVGGPSVSTQVSIVNGAMSQARAYTWALRPRTTGPAEIGALQVKLKSGERATAPIPIEVVAGSARPAERPRDPLDPFGGDDPFERLFGRQRRASTPPKLHVEASVSRAKLYVGEPLVLTYFVVTQTTVTDLAFANPPQYPGFWSEDLARPEGSPGGEPVTVEGESYRRFAFLQKLLFPTKAGPLEIPPARLRLSVPRGSGFFLDPVNAVVERQTVAIKVTAESLPVQAGFDGAVGSFRASATLDRPSLALGEAATLRFRVEGRGNLKWIDQAPEVGVSGAKVYPPQAKTDLKVTTAGMAGSKTWEFVVVPETGGTLEVPPVSFSYFDPEAKRVVSATTEPLSLRVDAAAAAGPGPFAVPAAPALAAGRLALRSDLDAHRPVLPLLAASGVALALAGVVLAHGLLWGSSVWRDRRLQAEGRSTTRRSVRASLAQLERVARGGLTKEAAAALVERTLHDVFGPLEDGTGPAPSEKEKELRRVLDAVHFVRYAPQLGDYSEKVRELAARAAEVVRRWA